MLFDVHFTQDLRKLIENYSMNGTEDKHNVSDGLKGNEDRLAQKNDWFFDRAALVSR